MSTENKTRLTRRDFLKIALPLAGGTLACTTLGRLTGGGNLANATPAATPTRRASFTATPGATNTPEAIATPGATATAQVDVVGDSHCQSNEIWTASQIDGQWYDQTSLGAQSEESWITAQLWTEGIGKTQEARSYFLGIRPGSTVWFAFYRGGTAWRLCGLSEDQVREELEKNSGEVYIRPDQTSDPKIFILPDDAQAFELLTMYQNQDGGVVNLRTTEEVKTGNK